MLLVCFRLVKAPRNRLPAMGDKTMPKPPLSLDTPHLPHACGLDFTILQDMFLWGIPPVFRKLVLDLQRRSRSPMLHSHLQR